MKILVIALSGIGDALMFTPSILKLKDDIPDCDIDALVMFNGVKEIYVKLPHIRKVHFHDFLNSNKIDSLLFVLSLYKKYDVVINVYPANRKEYNLISWLTGAKTRLAVEYLRQDKSNWGSLNNLRIKEDDSLHNVEENIRMCEKLTGEKVEEIPPLQFPVDKSDIVYAGDYFAENGIKENDLVIGFHAGCSPLKNHDKRRWEPEKFAELGKLFIEKFNARILLFGGPEERNLKTRIKDGINSLRVISVNSLSISKSAGVMMRCNLFITNDSSLMHVAAALKLDIVVIIGPTNKNYISPWKTNYKIVSLNLDCSPCFYYSPKPLTCSRTDVKFKCIKELSVNLVFEKAKEFLEAKKVNNLFK
jgi:heptosyltransferase-2